MALPRQRVDKVLVALKWATSRTKAQELIAAGFVLSQGKVVVAANTLVDPQDLSMLPVLHQDVGRGAEKIRPVLTQSGWDCRGKICADCGASTGGFTQVLLAAGAAKVYAIDVGHGQMAPGPLADPRVINLEGINLKYPTKLDMLVDYAVVDLSFISLRLTILNIFALVRLGGEVLALWKPQFEVGREKIGKNGVVTDETVIEQAITAFGDWCRQNGLQILQVLPAPITGKRGNQEFFFHLVATVDESLTS